MVGHQKSENASLVSSSSFDSSKTRRECKRTSAGVSACTLSVAYFLFFFLSRYSFLSSGASQIREMRDNSFEMIIYINRRFCPLCGGDSAFCEHQCLVPAWYNGRVETRPRSVWKQIEKKNSGFRRSDPSTERIWLLQKRLRDSSIISFSHSCRPGNSEEFGARTVWRTREVASRRRISLYGAARISVKRLQEKNSSRSPTPTYKEEEFSFLGDLSLTRDCTVCGENSASQWKIGVTERSSKIFLT